MAGLDKKAADGLQLRADKLHDHLAHQYRRSCTLSNGCATRCIPYALSGAGAFGCSCTHTHEMSAEEDNERFYLVEDLRGAIATLRSSVPSGKTAEDWGAELDERGEEVAAFEQHLALYQAHLP